MGSPLNQQRALQCIAVVLLLIGNYRTYAAPETELDLPTLEKLPSLWVKTLELRMWTGYKDNVLLSNLRPKGSPFVAGGIDLSLFRVPLNGWEFITFASGDYTRYLSVSEGANEATAMAQGQIRKTFAESWRAGFNLEYLYFNQVFDNSTVSTQLLTFPVEGHGFTLRPFVGTDFGLGYHLDLELPVSRQIFGELVDDYWEGGPKLTFGKYLNNKSDLSASYQYSDRFHDTREARDAEGELLLGHGLRFTQHDFQVTWRQNWDSKKHWRTVTRLGFQRNEDNGGGYYDYWRPQISQQLRWQAASWEARAEIKLSRYEYDRQPIDFGSSEIRHKTYVRGSVRAEKSFTKKLRIFADYEHEGALSNLSLDEYSVNLIEAGLNWEF